MRSRLSFFLAALAFGAVSPAAFAAGSEDSGPVTKAPVEEFQPPSGYHRYAEKDGRFLLGTPDL